MKKDIVLNINNIDYSISIEPRETLLFVLRERLSLTGTKYVCGTGECGACTVLVDGNPILACCTLAMGMQNRKIITVENEDKITQRLQKAFVEAGAIQCGYCTPGMITTAKSLLEENPAPSREEVVRYLGGNLCRCTGYVKIVDAVMNACAPDAPIQENEEEYHAVGKRVAQPDALGKARGRTKYISDMQMPQMLYGKVLRSPYPSAQVTRLDISKARALPGVEIVLTPDDMKKWNKYERGMKDLPMVSGGYSVPAEETILTNTPRHYGDAIVAVAATNERIAEEAISLVEIEWKELPFVTEPRQAMQPGAPQISPLFENNVAKELDYPLAEGDTEKALAESPCVVEGVFHTTKQEQCTEELAACVAQIDADDRLVVWSQCQLGHIARRELAHIFKMSVHKVRIHTPQIGGSFGQRGALCAEPICVALAMETLKPVKLVFSREENFTALESRTAFEVELKMGFKPDGVLQAMHTEMIGKLGGYIGCGPMASGIAMILGMGHYNCPNRSGHAAMVLTNTPASGAMRGFGNPTMMWAMEQVMDEAAEKLSICPVELRLKNIKKTGEIGGIGTPIQSIHLEECIEKGAKVINWHDKREKTDSGNIRRGIGMATASHCSGAPGLYLDHSNAVIKLNEDGTASLIVHPGSVGQHIGGALSQIAAEELGVRMEDIHLVAGDTDVSLFEFGTDASRSTYGMGNAVCLAARQAKEQILQYAEEQIKVPADQLQIKDRMICDKQGCPKISLAEICHDAIYNFSGNSLNFFGKSSWEGHVNSPASGAFFAEVEVDMETGVVKVIEFVVAIDCGKAINPMSVEGQIEGAIQQGIGYALTENYQIDSQTGIVPTINYDSYKMPGPLDMPKIKIILIDKPDPAGPFGAKGVGEMGIIGVAPAIANAIFHATGVRVRDLPVTPEKITRELRNKVMNTIEV